MFGFLPAISLASLNNGLISLVFFLSATCCAIQNLVSSSIKANRYLLLPFTLRYNSSVLHTSETFGLIFSRYFCINPTYLLIHLYTPIWLTFTPCKRRNF